jgi:hypothetical protein
MLLCVETMWISLFQSNYTSCNVSKKSVTLDGAKTLITNTSAFALQQDNLLPSLESLKM